MIKLNKNPMAGSAVRVNLSFRDPSGSYYIPTCLRYSVLALNSDGQSWSTVDGKWKVPIAPASSVNLSVPDMRFIEGTKPQRKIIVEWEAFLDGGLLTFEDEVDFEVEPFPTVENPPPEPLPEVWLEAVGVEVLNGSLFQAPVEPTFKITLSEPAIIENASANVGEIECSLALDPVGTVLTVVPDRRLEAKTEYSLEVKDVVSVRDGRQFKGGSLKVSFTTGTEGASVQDLAEVTIRENESIVVDPDEGFDSMKKVIVNVEIPIQDEKAMEITEDGQYRISHSSEYAAMREVSVAVVTKSLYGYRTLDGNLLFLFTKELKEDGQFKCLAPTKDFIETDVAIPELGKILVAWEGADYEVARSEPDDISR